jgi:hypothetical protein
VSLGDSIILLLTVLPAADPAGSVTLHNHAPSSVPLQMACDRLAEYLQSCPESGEIRTSRHTEPDPALGEEGYAIRSEGRTITIEANTDAGAANGVYTLLRTLMIEDRTSPWERAWELREKPALRWRSMMVAPYNFGGAHGFSIFSPDQWTFQHWQAYLEYLRLLNLNVVGLYPMRLYDPAIPETWPNKTRYEIWEQVLDYAHRLGLKFTWVQTANQVHQETWWRHPELRPGHEFGWFGCSLCYSKGRDLVRQTQRHTFERFKNADYFMLMFSDGGGACYCDDCSRDQAAVFLRMVADTQETLRDVNSPARVIFWNWALDWWYRDLTGNIPEYSQKFPQVSRIQQDVFEQLSRDVVFEDITAVPAVFGGHQQDTLVQAKEQGFADVIAFAYVMNPELRMFAFPQPRIRMMSDMLQYVRDKGLAGIDGYRLAPHGRVLNDYVFMRLAWNPDLTPDQLIDEMAGYLTSRPENRAKVVEGIKALDAYWEGRDQLANSDRAATLFDEAKVGEPSYQLEYTADMLSLLPGIHRLNHGNLPPEEAAQVRQKLFAETQRRYILQGFGSTDYQWVPEANGYFREFLDLCVPVPVLSPPLPEPASSSEQVER